MGELRQLDRDKQVQVLLALVTVMLNDRTKETKLDSLLKKLALEKHNKEKHKESFEVCSSEDCAEAHKLLKDSKKREITFPLLDLKMLKSFRLHYGSRLAGTVTAWLEEETQRIIL